MTFSPRQRTGNIKTQSAYLAAAFASAGEQICGLMRWNLDNFRAIEEAELSRSSLKIQF